ncbi:MAG: GspH/FimT family pseudopilin [Hydrogenophilales bacterium]|nr:GspH/FimT family pseudopilin [Hydrogenophilales bacterium]
MKSIRGFTLIELVMSIAIVGILLTVGIPSFRELITNNRIVSQTNDFVSDLAHARAEAVRRNTRVTICRSNTGTSCVPASSWADGWIVFTDPGGFGTYTSTSADEKLLRVHSAMPTGMTLAVAGFQNSGDYLQFLPSGLVSGVTGGSPTTAGTFTLCVSGYKGRTINFNAIGRVNITAMTSNCT